MKEEILQTLYEDKQKNALGVQQQKQQDNTASQKSKSLATNQQSNPAPVAPQKRTISEEELFRQIELQIKNNHFTSKEELMRFITNSKEIGVTMNNTKTNQLLNLYDELYNSKESPLNMEKYSNAKLDDKNLIISKEDDRVLVTQKDSDEFINEFKQTQNEISANTQDGLANADAVFHYMADNQKEEMILMSLNEASQRNDIEIEVLNKMVFFVTKIKEDLRPFKVDIKTGIFYNSETSEVYEVRKNEKTGEYEIFRGKEKIYADENEILEDKEEEKKDVEMTQENELEQTLYKAKVRVRKKETYPPMGNAAFTKTSFLIVSIILFATLITTLILLNK